MLFRFADAIGAYLHALHAIDIFDSCDVDVFISFTLQIAAGLIFVSLRWPPRDNIDT